jgi:small GTP-binding protein
LQKLYLSGNQLTAVSEAIAQLTNLQELSLGGNQLTGAYAIAQLTNLQELYLHGNRLKTVPAAIAQLINLRTLYLNYNQLTVVPRWLVELPKLRDLYLNNNPIETPPPEIFGDNFNTDIYDFNVPSWLAFLDLPVDLAALLAYFQQQEVGTDRLYEAKLLIVGEPGAGKTSLTRKLIDPAAPLPGKDESTEGIDVHAWTFPITVDGERLSVSSSRSSVSGERPSVNDEQLRDSDHRIPNTDHQFRVNIWDFGGQEIYHATHQFFLSRRSLYVVVADAREQKTDFFHWLDLIEHLSDRSPVFIFNNEVQNRHWAINEQQLQAHFPHTFQAPFAFNLADDRIRLEDLRRKIQEQISRLPHVGDTLPATWVNVRRALETDERATIALRDFLQLCRDNGFTRRADALQLSRYLHDIGVILHFQDDPLLKKTVILRPEWGTDAAYGVLDNQRVKDNSGRFSRADLEAIWQREDYDYLHDELLALMMKFQLCYEIPGRKGWYIAPQLLGEQPPQDGLSAESATGSLHLRYKYEAFMPKGVLSRFIVALHRQIAGGGEWVWRTGVVLEKDGARAEVVEYYHRRELRIRVTGKNRKDLLTIISYELDKLHAPFHRLEYDKLIPCNCPTCRDSGAPNSYPLKILQRFKHDRQPQIQCSTSYQMVDVQSLIDDIGPLAHAYDLPDLLRRLEATFSKEEARTLCLELGIDYDDLGGRGRKANLRELVARMDRHGRLSDLIELVERQRPYQAR